MGFILLIFMIGIPIAEIAVFIEAGDAFGFWPTLGTVIFTAVIGTWFLRIQGLGVLKRVQESAASGQAPMREVFDGLCLLMAGALLLTPGFITDSVGFALLVPPVRQLFIAVIGRYIMAKGVVHTASYQQQSQHGTSSGFNQRGGQGGGPIIDGDFQETPEYDPDTPIIEQEPDNKP